MISLTLLIRSHNYKHAFIILYCNLHRACYHLASEFVQLAILYLPNKLKIKSHVESQRSRTAVSESPCSTQFSPSLARISRNKFANKGTDPRVYSKEGSPPACRVMFHPFLSFPRKRTSLAAPLQPKLFKPPRINLKTRMP